MDLVKHSKISEILKIAEGIWFQLHVFKFSQNTPEILVWGRNTIFQSEFSRNPDAESMDFFQNSTILKLCKSSEQMNKQAAEIRFKTCKWKLYSRKGVVIIQILAKYLRHEKSKSLPENAIQMAFWRLLSSKVYPKSSWVPYTN